MRFQPNGVPLRQLRLIEIWKSAHWTSMVSSMRFLFPVTRTGPIGSTGVAKRSPTFSRRIGASGPSRASPLDSYNPDDDIPVARSYIEAAASGRPRPVSLVQPPNDAGLLELMYRYAPDEAMLEKDPDA